MYVKDRMTKHPYCIHKDTTVSEALELMKAHDFHRLPVVDSQGALIGLITKGLIQENTPSKATSLSIYELNYLMNKAKVGEFMITDVKTIGPDALLEEAAVIMRSSNVGCLPVVENNRVKGMITQNDLFDAFIDLLGYNLNGARYVINIAEDKVGVFKDISACLSSLDININKIGVYQTERGIEVVVLASADHTEAAKALLTEKGYNVTSITIKQ